MTKFAERGGLLGTGARVLSAEELDWVSGGDGEEEIVITGVRQTPITFTDVFGNPVFSDHESYADAAQRYEDLVNDIEPQLVLAAKEDHCGSGITSDYVPDTVCGVYIGGACKTHDANYSPNTTMSRVEADLTFAIDIYNTLVDGGCNAAVASAYAFIYFEGVRQAGIFFYQGPFLQRG